MNKEHSLTLHSRADCVAVARGWIGTPYHHQASRQGVGCDCLGLIRGVYRQLYGFEAEMPPGYSLDWAEASGVETLLEAARRHMIERDPGDAQPGDVLVFRYRTGIPAKHCGILSTSQTMIHAVENAPVTEVSLSAWWRRRIAGLFSFPGMVL